jgi:hypothetical protein
LSTTVAVSTSGSYRTSGALSTIVAVSTGGSCRASWALSTIVAVSTSGSLRTSFTLWACCAGRTSRAGSAGFRHVLFQSLQFGFNRGNTRIKSSHLLICDLRAAEQCHYQRDHCRAERAKTKHSFHCYSLPVVCCFNWLPCGSVLTALAQNVIGQYNCHHCFAHRYRTDADTGVVPPLCSNFHRLTIDRDTGLRDQE